MGQVARESAGDSKRATQGLSVAADARREQILAGAMQCFIEGGYHDTTMDQIAERAGVSKGAIYWYYRGKRDVFLALMDQTIGQFASQGSAIERVESGVDGILAVSRLFQQLVKENLPLAELRLEYLAHATRDEPIRAKFRDGYLILTQVMAAQIHRGIEEGAIRPVDAEATAINFTSTLDGLHMRKVFLPSLDLERLWREAEDLFLSSIRVA